MNADKMSVEIKTLMKDLVTRQLLYQRKYKPMPDRDKNIDRDVKETLNKIYSIINKHKIKEGDK